MIYSIKCDGVEVARLSGDHIEFGQKMASQSLMETRRVPDREILVQKDAEGRAIWVMNLSHRGNLTVEEMP
jgi:hypothetical protein